MSENDKVRVAGLDFEGKIDKLLELVMGLGNDINLINQRLDYIEKDQIRDLRETIKLDREAMVREVSRVEKTHEDFTKITSRKIDELEAWRNKIIGVGGAMSFILVALQIYQIITP